MALGRTYSFRASTCLLALAVAALAVGFAVGRVAVRWPKEHLGFLGGALVLAAFPILSICASLSSLVYLIRRRQLQHLVEFLVSLGLVAWFSTWESL